MISLVFVVFRVQSETDLSGGLSLVRHSLSLRSIEVRDKGRGTILLLGVCLPLALLSVVSFAFATLGLRFAVPSALAEVLTVVELVAEGEV